MSGSPAEVIGALATPFGESALAVIRVSGPDLRPLIEAVHRRVLKPRQATFVPLYDSGGEVIDEVVALYFPGPRSYTGEDVWEISCHGNPLIAQKILSSLHHRGVRAAEPGEFTRRAFFNGKMDLSQAEAVIDLIRARSDRALEAAAHQIKGVLGDRIRNFVDRLLQVLAELEAYIDFPEEDLPPEDQAGPTHRLHQLIEDISRLAATSRYGALLRDGVRVALIGAPNAGKSSLLNLFLSRERALVSDIPGTTRDFLEEKITLGKHAIRLLDTAGLHASNDPIEQAGMRKTVEELSTADICLWVIDQAQPNLALPPEAGALIEGRKTFVLLNKADLPSPSEAALPSFSHPLYRLSAKTGDGFRSLVQAIEALIEEENPGHQRDWIAVSHRHAEALQEAQSALNQALQLLRDEAPVELAVSECRGAIEALSRIIGKIDNEEMLDRLFASFCIGK